MAELQTKVIIEILGEQYPIKGNAESEHIVRVADWLNDRMKKISQSNSRLSHHQIAVMAAMNLADEYLKLESDYRELISMVKQQKR